MNQTHTYIVHSGVKAFVASILIVALGALTFFVSEPSISRAITDEFTVTQSVTSEISFLTTAANVSMSPSLGGVTGGLSSGTTTVVVSTNDSSGYNMTIAFASTSGNPGIAMNGTTQGGYISNYTSAATDTPDFTFSVAANTAEFAYTVAASTTADLDTTFRNNGAVCNNNSGGDASFSCWFGPTTSPGVSERIVNRTSETVASGATTSIAFRVQISSNPAPAVPEDTYVATATLTALAN